MYAVCVMQLMSMASMKREKDVKKLKATTDKATKAEIAGHIKRMYTKHEKELKAMVKLLTDNRHQMELVHQQHTTSLTSFHQLTPSVIVGNLLLY